MNRFLLLALVVLFACSKPASGPDQVMVAVKRNYDIPKKSEAVVISIPWNELISRAPGIERTTPIVTDKNFGTNVPVILVDNNSDNKPDYLSLEYTLNSNEPVFTFLIHAGEKRQDVVPATQEADVQFGVSFLTPLREYEKKNGAIADFSSALVNSTMNQYPDLKDFPVYAPDRWNYEYSFFMAGAYRQGKKVNNPEYVSYAKRWIDGFITAGGTFRSGVYKMKEYKL